jgi:Domain of unknown function (DUF4282)
MMGDFFAFRTMIAAGFIQVIFVIGLAGIVLASLGAIANDQAITGLLVLAFGTLYWRVICEVFIVFFRMNDTLSGIKADTATMSSASSTPSAPPPPDSALAIEPA